MSVEVRATGGPVRERGLAAACARAIQCLSRLFLQKDRPASAADPSYRMRVLSAIAISFVVLGHINFTGSMETTFQEPGTFQGWFPYYSFHLPLFLFVSGYFFKDLPRDRHCFPALLRFIGKKAVKLLLPYYIFTGLSLLFNGWIHTQGFTFGDGFTWQRWLLSPWIKPYVITFATPAWYLPALFIAEMMLLLLRFLFQLVFRRSALRETLLLAVTLGAGVYVVHLKKTASPSPAEIVYLRSALMLFFMQVGALYRRHLEKHDTLKSGWYFLIVFAAQFLVIVLCNNGSLSPGIYELRNIDKTVWAFFLSAMTGTLLWLRVSGLIASLPHKSPVVAFVGKNTLYIMGLHVFSWFLLNTLLNHLYAINRRMVLVTGFDRGWYQSFLYYCHVTNPRMIVVYYLVGMALPLLIALILQGAFKGLGWIRKKTGEKIGGKIGKRIALKKA